MISFKKMNTILEDKKVMKKDEKVGEYYLFHILYHQLSVEGIDFDSFELRDLDFVTDNFIDEYLLYQDADDTYHVREHCPFYVMSSNFNMVRFLNKQSFKRVPSRRVFL